MRATEARRHTLGLVADLGFPEPPAHLPLLADDEEPFTLRRTEEVIERILVLNVRIGLAFGMPPSLATEWLHKNDLLNCVTAQEGSLLSGATDSDEQEQLQVEALWALAWALGLTPSLDPGSYCGDDLVSLLPNLQAPESAQDWRTRTKPRLRPIDELLKALDLLYVMSWGLADANLIGRAVPGAVDQYVIWERRRAIEFLRDDSGGHASWDEIDLST